MKDYKESHDVEILILVELLKALVYNCNVYSNIVVVLFFRYKLMIPRHYNCNL